MIRSRVDAVMLHRVEKYSSDEQHSLVNLLEDPKWPEELRFFAYSSLIPNRFSSERMSREFEGLEAKMNFILAHVPLELLSANQESRNIRDRSIFTANIRFLQAIDSRLGEAGWRDILSDPQKEKQFHEACAWGNPSGLISLDDYAHFEQRDSVSLEADEGLEDRLVELGDVLRVSGIDQIALPLVRSIKFATPSSPDSLFGKADDKTANIQVSSSDTTRHGLPVVLLHEIGHTLEFRIAQDERARELFDEYILLTQLERTEHSPYARSYQLEKNMGMYVRESFAEDFRLYWIAPERLTPGKLEIFEQFCAEFLSNVDQTETRHKIRYTLGNYYSISVADVLDKTDCTTNEEQRVQNRGRDKKLEKLAIMEQDVGLEITQEHDRALLSFEAGHWEQVGPYNKAIQFYFEEAGLACEQKANSGLKSGTNTWLIHGKLDQGKIDEILAKVKRAAKIKLSDDREAQEGLILEQVLSEKARRRAGGSRP